MKDKSAKHRTTSCTLDSECMLYLQRITEVHHKTSSIFK